MMQLTRRDEQMLDWLNVVRMADVDAIQWALAGLSGGIVESPVTARRANQWIARMVESGLLGSERPMYRQRQIVWPTHRATGRAAPTLFRQTMRHELAVASVAARYLAQGFVWARDRRPTTAQGHQGDGVASKGGLVDLVEVELTAKAASRYRMIHSAHAQRLQREVDRVVYFCTIGASEVVSREADKFVFREQRGRILCLPLFDDQGRWIADPPDLG